MFFPNIPSPALSLKNNQKGLVSDKSRIDALISAVGETHTQIPAQWVQLMAFTLEFKPDLIIELGRSSGNSTCAFTEACHLMGPGSCEVASICISNDWDFDTLPGLKKIVDEDWFKPLTIIRADIIDFDFSAIIVGKKKVLVFWDAHGFEIAEKVLGDLLPQICDRQHVVIMHDMTDNRYNGGNLRLYGDNPLWKGKNDFSGPRIWIDNIESCVEQAVAITDFSRRNGISPHSSDESYFTEFSDDEWKNLTEAFGSGYVCRNGHWFWISLNESSLSYTFPKFIKRGIFPVMRAKFHIVLMRLSARVRHFSLKYQEMHHNSL